MSNEPQLIKKPTTWGKKVVTREAFRLMPSQWVLRLANFSVLLPSLAKAFTTRIPGMVSVSTLVTPAQARQIRRYRGVIFLRNFRENITLEDLGKQFNLNPFYLQKQFKRFVGQTPSEYVIYLRMTHAKELLRNSRKTIGEIAAEVGIENLGYFSRLFKKQEGMSPRDYSKLWPTNEGVSTF